MLKAKEVQEIDSVVDLFLTKGDAESHGSRISAKEASEMGLVVNIVDNRSAHWNLVWEIYVRCDHYTRQRNLAKYICADAGGLEVQAKQMALG